MIKLFFHNLSSLGAIKPDLQGRWQIANIQHTFLYGLIWTWGAFLIMPGTLVAQHEGFALKFLDCSDSGRAWNTELFCWKPLSLLFTARQYISSQNEGWSFVFLEYWGDLDDSVPSLVSPRVSTMQVFMGCLACGVKPPVQKQSPYIRLCACACSPYFKGS